MPKKEQDWSQAKIKGEGHHKLEIWAAHLAQFCSNHGISHKQALRLFRTFNQTFFRSKGLDFIFDDTDNRLATVIHGVLGMTTVVVDDLSEENKEEFRGEGLL